MGDTDRPNLHGKADPAVVRAVNKIYEHIAMLKGMVAQKADAGSIQQGIKGLSSRIKAAQQDASVASGYEYFTNGDSTSAKLQGSSLPYVTGSLSYVSDGTTITWSWTNLLVQWPNADNDPIADSSLKTTGLGNSTTYKFYPFINVSEQIGAVEFSTKGAGTGTPADAYAATDINAAQDQIADLHVPVSSGGIAAATTGGAPGPGGSGGGSGCIQEDMVCLVKDRGIVRILDVEVGELVACRAGWTVMLKRKVTWHSEFVEMELDNAEPPIAVTAYQPLKKFDAEGIAGFIRSSDWPLSALLDGIKRPFQVLSLRLRKRRARAVIFHCEPYNEFLFGAVTPCVTAHNTINLK